MIGEPVSLPSSATQVLLSSIFSSLTRLQMSLSPGLKWDDNKSRAWRDGLSCQTSRRYAPSFAECVLSLVEQIVVAPRGTAWRQISFAARRR